MCSCNRIGSYLAVICYGLRDRWDGNSYKNGNIICFHIFSPKYYHERSDDLLCVQVSSGMQTNIYMGRCICTLLAQIFCGLTWLVSLVCSFVFPQIKSEHIIKNRIYFDVIKGIQMGFALFEGFAIGVFADINGKSNEIGRDIIPIVALVTSIGIGLLNLIQGRKIMSPKPDMRSVSIHISFMPNFIFLYFYMRWICI